jgi:hypothetical protein
VRDDSEGTSIGSRLGHEEKGFNLKDGIIALLQSSVS